MTVKQIILIEPFAHFKHGHYRDKLILWLEELKALRIEVILVTMNDTRDFDDHTHKVHHLPNTLKAILQKLPFILSRILLIASTYSEGIKLSKQNNIPLLGLTSRSALPIWLATLAAGMPSQPWGYHLMNPSLNGLLGKVQKIAFKKIFQKKCQIFANLIDNVETIDNLTKISSTIYLPDPIRLYPFNTTKETDAEKSLLILGKDTPRRNALAAIIEQTLPEPIKTLHLHATGATADQLSVFKKKNPSVEIIITEGFCSPDEFASFFHKAHFCLIAYHPDFNAGSGNLANAVTHGVTVISSRTKYAEYIEQNYPGCIHFYEYDQNKSLQKAMIRAVEQYDKNRANKKTQQLRLRNDLSSTHITTKCLELLSY